MKTSPGVFLLLVGLAGLMGSWLAPLWLADLSAGQVGRGMALLGLNVLLLWLLLQAGRRLVRRA